MTQDHQKKIIELMEDIAAVEKSAANVWQDVVAQTDLARTFEAEVERLNIKLEEAVKAAMQAEQAMGVVFDEPRYQVPLDGELNMVAEFSWVKGRESVVVHDAAAVPHELTREKREPDKALIKRFLEKGPLVNWGSIEQAAPKMKISYKKIAGAKITA